MKKQTLLALVLLGLLSSHVVFANGKKLAKAETKAASRAQLGTSFRFNPNAFHGKRQVSPSLTATVENDKYLDDLLAPRKSFNDRIEQDNKRN